MGFSRVACGCVGVGWGLRVEVEVLDDERTCTSAVVKDFGGSSELSVGGGV